MGDGGIDQFKGDIDELAKHVTHIFLTLKILGKIFERNKTNGLTDIVSSEGWWAPSSYLLLRHEDLAGEVHR